MISAVSFLAIAVILAAVAMAYTRRFLAAGALVIANLVVHLLSIFGGSYIILHEGTPVGTRTVIQQELGLHGDLLAAGEPIAFLQLVTSMFVHANFFHLAGNLIILLAFALPFEERIGHRAFLGMYLLSGLAGAMAQLATTWGQPILLIGASGAVFGIIGAFAGSYPRLVLPLPIPGPIILFVRMRVIMAALLFTALQFGLLYLSGGQDNTAYFAHIGGLAAGLVLAATYVRARKPAASGQPAKATIDLDRLRPFARSLPAQNALARLAMSMDEPVLAAAWMEKFLEHARCPQTDGPVGFDRGHLVCPDGQRIDVRAR